MKMSFIRVVVSILILIVIAIGILVLVNIKAPQEFQYKHHDYIYFPGKGVIHSPECRQCTLTFETI